MRPLPTLAVGRHCALRVLATVCMAACFASASSAQLSGSTVGLDRLYPNTSTTSMSLGERVVGPGIEFTEPFGDISPLGVTIDVGDAFLTITNVSGVGIIYGFGAFNGYRLVDTMGTLPAFTDAVIGASNVAGFTASRVFFEPDRVYVNFENLTVGAGQSVTVNLALAATTAVPEPGMVALTATGLCALAGFAGRRPRS
jgi:hypothetical protein